MRIGFITSHHKTIFFHAIASQLEQEGHEVFWVSPSHVWAEWLAERGVPHERILDITAYHSEWTKPLPLEPTAIEELKELEERNGWSLKELVLMDRLLSKKKFAASLRYLYIAQKYLKRFLSQNRIEVLFSEQTWAFELLATQVCTLLGIPSYAPGAARIPDGRFVFFKEHLQREIASFAESMPEDQENAKKFYEDFLERKPKPSYFYLNNKKPNVQLRWFAKLANHFLLSFKDPYDLTRPSLSSLVSQRFKEVWNRWITSLFYRFERAQPDDSAFVLYTLHKQPESSIDVLASFYSNQLENIKTIARTLPVDHTLYVKEHSNAIGDRSIAFYKEITRIPGVKLIDPYANTYALIQKARLVIAPSGTVCYEAGVLGIPSLTLSPMYFDSLLTAKTPLLNMQDFRQMHRILQEGKKDLADPHSDNKKIDFLARIYANSFEGLIDTPTSNPECMSEKNISLVSRAFSVFLGKLHPTLQQSRD